MIAVLPGLALDPAARGADDRRGQRRRDRRRAVPRAGLRPAVRRRRGQAGRAVREARHARRAWAAPTCCPRWSARRTPATCCSPAGSSTPTRRSGSGWSRGCSSRRRSATRCSTIAAGIAATAPDRQPAHQAGAARRRPRRPRDRAAVGGAGPAGHAGHRGPAGGHPRPARRSGRRSSAAAEPSTSRRDEAPGPPTRDPPSPCEISPDGPGGLVCGATLGGGARAGSTPRPPPCGQPCGQLCGQPSHRGDRPRRRDEPVDNDSVDAAVNPRLTSTNAIPPAVDEKQFGDRVGRAPGPV